MKLFIVGLVVILSGCAASAAIEQFKNSAVVRSSNEAPVSQLARLPITSLPGESATNLEEYLGNGTWTLVVFWSSVMHISMHEEILVLDDEIDESQMRIVGVSIDGPQGINKQREQQFLSAAKFPNFRADPAEIFRRYELLVKQPLTGTPSSVLFDRQGKPVANSVGVTKRHFFKEIIADNE